MCLVSSEKVKDILFACWNNELVTILLKPIGFRQLIQVHMLTSNFPLKHVEGGAALEDSSKLQKVSGDIN